MNKTLSVVLLILLLAPSLVLAQANPTGGHQIVPCDGPDCTICSFFQMLVIIYNFIVYDIGLPLAIVALIIGGILVLTSAGNPNSLSLGKKIIYAAIIGLVLAFCSFLIIQFILNAMGYRNVGSWASPSIGC